MPEPDEPHYRLSVVAELLQIHPDTVRRYERRGLIRPRLLQGEKVYTESCLVRMRRIGTVTELGVNLAGAEVVCNLLDRLEELHQEHEALREQLRRLLEQAP